MSPDLEAFRKTYEEMFGTVPPLPAGRFEFASAVNPEFLRKSEALRAHVFYNEVFDMKTTQLMLFGMLLVEHLPAAQFHAVAARRAGASWRELAQVVELASATKSLGPANQGLAMLNTLKQNEKA